VEYITGMPREQLFLFNQSLDDLIDKKHIVRFIDAYVNSLDMEQLDFIIPKLKTGTPPYSPQLKLKIYIYGYFEKIRTSRRLEKECHRNKELIWLTKELAPDFKTIADFRKDNSKAFKNVFKNFLKFCHKLELISFKTVAIDGTKMRGQNSLNEVYKKENIENIEKEIQEQIDNYIKELDEMDQMEKTRVGVINQDKMKEITTRLTKQIKRKDKIENIKTIFSKDPKLETYFSTDKDCKLQSDKGKVRAGYNPQTAVEDKNKLIVVADVTNKQNDKKQFSPMINQVMNTKKELKVEGHTNGIGDSGYFSEKAILDNLSQDDLNVIISSSAEENKTNKDDNKKLRSLNFYQQKDFKYHRKNDIYICPEKKELKKIGRDAKPDKNGRDVNVYKCDLKICNICLQKAKCTKGVNGRKLTVSANKEKMEKYIEDLKTKENKMLIKKRKEIVEHPFGTIKRSFGYTYFLLKGLEKVKAEFSFICFTYNLKRVLNIVPMDKLITILND